MLSNIEVAVIHQLSDNFSYIIYSPIIKKAIIVDPADSNPLIDFLKNHDLSFEGILITHHHSDHTSGIKGLLEFKTVDVYSPNLNILGTSKLIKDMSNIVFEFIDFQVMATPGHTLDHIVFYNVTNNLLFAGDTLFCYGCGRVFEGTMKQMLDSLKKIRKLPDDTKVYCGHEYTYKNLEFVLNELVAFPNTSTVKTKCRDKIKKNGSSMPFYLGHQKSWNPFLNCDDNIYKEGIANFHKNEGKIGVEASELDFFTFIRNKRNAF